MARTRKNGPTWAEKGSGPTYVKLGKREARRARRRGRTEPWMVKSLTQTYRYNVS